MTDSSLLPYNATKFEKDVEAAIRYNINTDYLSSFKFDPVGDNVSLALSWEYSLGQINVENFKDRVVQGLKFYRLRGTPYALRLALSWYGFDDIGIEEEEPGEHFAEFQVDLKEVPNNLEVDKIVEAARSAAPLRSRLSRMYNELYDIRRFILDHSDWGDFLSDNSGYQPYEDSPKFSFGRVNTFQLAIEKPKLQYARSIIRYVFAENNDTYKLDWTILDESDIGVLNHEIRRSVWRFMSNRNCVFDGNDHVFEQRQIPRALIVLSEDAELDDINCCFSCGYETHDEPTPFTLSFSYLSEHTVTREQVLVVNREIQQRSFYAKSEFEITAERGAKNNITMMTCDANFAVDYRVDKERIHDAEYRGNNLWHDQKHFEVSWKNQRHYLGHIS